MQPQHLIPEIDEGVPLPIEALPELSAKEEIEMRARTVKFISDLTGKPIEPTAEHREQAHQLMEQVISDKTTPNLVNYPNETLAYLGGMVAMYSGMVVRDLADLKLFVVNKLLQETEHPDSKTRLQALKAIGEIDGVDAFKRRTEVTHKTQSLEEVESELLETLTKLKKLNNYGDSQPITDVQAKEIPQADDETDD